MPAEANDLPQPPRLRTWRETVEELMQDYPEEFTSGGEESLKKQLHEIDERLVIEQNYQDSPAQSRHSLKDEELDEKIREDYRGYRDNKKWLSDD